MDGRVHSKEIPGGERRLSAFGYLQHGEPHNEEACWKWHDDTTKITHYWSMLVHDEGSPKYLPITGSALQIAAKAADMLLYGQVGV